MSLIKIVRIVSKRFEMNLPLSVANHTYIYLYVSHCLGLTRSQADTFLHCNIAPLWYRYASAVALGAAWLSFYQILALFKWMIPVLRRDQRTKSPLFLSDPLLSLFLPCPSLKAQLQSFVTPPKKRDFFFFPPKIPCRATSCRTFWGPPKGTGILVVSSHQQCFQHSVVSHCS